MPLISDHLFVGQWCTLTSHCKTNTSMDVQKDASTFATQRMCELGVEMSIPAIENQ